jgi:hypothetical protein
VRIFSAGVFTGNLGGIGGATTKCQNAAAGWAVGKNIKPMVSVVESGMEVGYAIAHLPQFFGMPLNSPVRNLPGSVLLGNSWKTMLQGGTPFQTLASAGVIPAGSYWWTGSRLDGHWEAPIPTCTDWTSADSMVNGQVGEASSTGGWWITRGPSPCDQMAHLLCAAWPNIPFNWETGPPSP